MYVMHDREPLWSEDSQAGREVAAARRLSSWHSHELHETQMLPFIMFNVIEDHLTGLAATLTAPRTVIAPVSLIRPVLEAASRCFYVMDPAVDVTERIRRGVNLRLQQAVETINVAADDPDESVRGIRANSVERLESLVSAAEIAGLEVKRGRADRLPANVQPLRWVDPRIPSAQKLLNELSADDGSPFLHRFTSGVLHAQVHALLPFVVAAERQRLPTGDFLVPFGISGRAMASLLAGPVSAIYSLMESSCEYYGWPLSTWRDQGLPVLTQWRNWLIEVPG